VFVVNGVAVMTPTYSRATLSSQQLLQMIVTTAAAAAAAASRPVSNVTRDVTNTRYRPTCS